MRKKHKNKWVSNYTCSLVYNSGDLLGAFHNISVTVNEMWINGCRYFQFLLEDKYDFKLENYSGNLAIKVGNNMALAIKIKVLLFHIKFMLLFMLKGDY